MPAGEVRAEVARATEVQDVAAPDAVEAPEAPVTVHRTLNMPVVFDRRGGRSQLHALGRDLTLRAVATLPWHASPLAVADFNGDGVSDLLATGPHGGWQVVERDGQAWWSGESSDVIEAARPCDLDGDDRSDAVLTTSTGLVLLHNPGHGTTAEVPIFVARRTRITVDCGDINGDGFADVVFSSLVRLESEDGGERGHVGAVLGGPGFTFTRAPFSADPARTGTPRDVRALHLQDVDGDGVLDVLTFHAAFSSPAHPPDFIVVQRGRGDGSFAWSSRTALVGRPLSAWARLDSDVSGDGRADLLSCGASACALRVQGDGGRFGAPIGVPNVPASVPPRDPRLWPRVLPPPSLHPLDLDGDGTVDLITGSPSHAGALWWRGGPHGFDGPRPLAEALSSGVVIGVDPARREPWIVSWRGNEHQAWCSAEQACDDGVCTLNLCEYCYLNSDCARGAMRRAGVSRVSDVGGLRCGGRVPRRPVCAVRQHGGRLARHRRDAPPRLRAAGRRRGAVLGPGRDLAHGAVHACDHQPGRTALCVRDRGRPGADLLG